MKPTHLLNQPYDISQAFGDTTDEYFIADRLEHFHKKGDSIGIKGDLRYAKHRLGLDWALGKMGRGCSHGCQNGNRTGTNEIFASHLQVKFLNDS